MSQQVGTTETSAAARAKLRRINNTRQRLSPSYFTGRPLLFDTLYQMDRFLQQNEQVLKEEALVEGPAPTIASALASHPWVSRSILQEAWQFKISEEEYNQLLSKLHQLSALLSKLQDSKLRSLIEQFRRPEKSLDLEQSAPLALDEWGRAYAEGERRRLKAHVWLVEATPEQQGPRVFIDGRCFVDALPRLKHRARVALPFKLTDTIGKYNVWCQVETSMEGMEKGESCKSAEKEYHFDFDLDKAIADALANGIAKALVTYEPQFASIFKQGAFSFWITKSI